LPKKVIDDAPLPFHTASPDETLLRQEGWREAAFDRGSNAAMACQQGARPASATRATGWFSSLHGDTNVPQSVLEAIRMGQWDFEPGEAVLPVRPTGAMPGTMEKIDVLAERLRLGLPLWHPRDRRSYDDQVNEMHEAN
jgi:hypothetical protein